MSTLHERIKNLYYNASKKSHYSPNALIISECLFRDLYRECDALDINSSPLKIGSTTQKYQTTYNGLKVLIVNNVEDLLQVTFLQDL